MHDVFHVSQLQKYIRNDTHGIDYLELSLRPNMSYEAQPISILDSQEVLKNKIIKLVRVIWNLHSPDDSTWELDEEIQKKYPHLFR